MDAAREQIRLNTRRVAGLMALLLVALVALLLYWQVVAADRLLDHPNNRRLAWLERRIHRGGIYDRRGVALAESDFATGRQVRRYPLGEQAAFVVGYQSVRYGRGGLEARYQSRLSGLQRHNGLQQLRNELLGRPEHGDEVFTTLDASLQRAAWAGLAGRRGAVVGIEPATGALRCLVSSPAFAPEALDETWDELRKSPDHPLFNRATHGLYPPGSTFKVVTTSAAVEFHTVLDSERFECVGTRKIDEYTIHCEGDRAHGTLDLPRALVVSCNCTYADLATRVGSGPLRRMAERFGLGRPVRMELPVQSSQVINPDAEWTITLLAQTGFGQGQLAVTPLQMALVAATIANEGKQAEPHLVKQVRTYEGQIMEERRQRAPRQVLSPTTATKVAVMMRAVVAKGSTRKVFRGLGATVAGKTGTAQNPHGRAHAWFIAFAPAEAPTLAVAVVVENAGSGSKVAAPIARRVLDAHIRAEAPAAAGRPRAPN